MKHHDALSDGRAAGLIVLRPVEKTGIPLDAWLATPKRGPTQPAPKPATSGPLSGQRIAILGEPRHGDFAQWIAAQGGRVVAAVGKTTNMLMVMADEPLGRIRYDTQFRRAQELEDAGSAIEIASAAAIRDRCAIRENRMVRL